MIKDRALRIALIYLAFAMLWILLSDHLLDLVTNSGSPLAFWQTVKGGSFVAVTSLGLFLLLRASYRQVEQREAQYRSLVESMPGMVCRWQPGGTLEFVNGNCAAAFGRVPEELVGRSFLELVPEEDRLDIERAVQALTLESPQTTRTQRVIGKHGPRWQQWTNALLTDGKGHTIGYQAFGLDVTEQKAAEAARDASIRRNEHLVRALGDIVYEWWPAQDRVVWEGDVEGILGYRLQDMGDHTTSWTDRIHADDVPEVMQELDHCVKEGRRYDLEYRFRASDGTYRWMHDQGVPQRNERGELETIVGVFRNITARKEAEAAAVTKDAEWKHLVENAPAILYRFSTERGSIYLSSQVERTFGYPRDRMIADPMLWPRSIHPEDQPRVAEVITGLKHGHAFELEYRVKDASGRWHWLLDRSIGCRHEGDDFIVEGLAVDVTERRSMEAALRESEARLRLFIEHAPAALTMLDREMRHVEVSRRWLEDYGLEDEAILGRSHYEVFPEIPDRWKALHRRCLAGESLHADEDRFERADGAVQWVKWEIRPWYADDGDVGGMLIFSEDITERKYAKQELENAHAQLAERERVLTSIFRAAPQGIGVIESGMIREANEAFLKLMGVSREETKGCSLRQCFQNEDEYQHLLAVEAQQIALSGASQIETRLRRKDGQRLEVLLQTAPLDPARPGEGSAFTITDLAPIRSLERHLRQAQKHEALGTLAGGIAHDFNNILGAILGFTELAQRRLDDRTRLEHYLQQLHVAGQRARELVRQILTFARKTDDEPSLVKVAPIFKEVGKLMRATLPTTIEIRTTVRAEADILGSPIELHQLMVNLCTNAAHAMEEPGGVMSLELDYLVAGSDELPRKLATRNENFLCLVVSDTGTGIPSHVRDRIFDPYFTTKEQGKGSGLGLAVVRGIVERLGGEIGVKSAVGRGTRMAVFLPVAEHGDAELGGKDIPAELPRGDEPVLLVDDEAALLEFGAEALRTLGYEVTPCARAEEALARVEQDPKKYRAVVSDVTMPGITGDRLASQLLEINPELRVLLCTGYTDRLAANDAQRIGVHAVLNKPLTVEELAVKVREALDQPAIASSTAKPSEH